MGKKKRPTTAPTKKSAKRKADALKSQQRPAEPPAGAAEEAVETISESLRAACHRSGRTTYRIAKDAGIPYPVLHRFLDGTRGLNLESADKLARYFRLALRHVPEATRQTGATSG